MDQTGGGAQPTPFDSAAPGDRPMDHRLGTDPRDIASLYVSHRHSLAVLAHRYLNNPFDVDEVVQEAFLRLVMSMPELETEAQAVAYARRTVTNLCFDRIRRNGRTPASTPLDELVVDIPADDGDLEDPILAAEDAVIVRSALARLAPTQRRALIAWEVEEKPVPEIAAELGIDESAVKHVLFRARRTLRRLLVGTAVDPSVDLLELSGPEVWGIAGQRAARGAQRLGVLLLLLALPALAVMAMLRSTDEAPSTVVAVPPAEVGGGLLEASPPSTVPAPVPVPGTPAPSVTSSVSPEGQPAPVGDGPSAAAVDGGEPVGTREPAAGSSVAAPAAGTPQPSSTSDPGRPSSSPEEEGSSPSTSTSPTQSERPSSTSPTPVDSGAVPRGFAVVGDLTSQDAGAVVVDSQSAGDGRPAVSSDLAFIANTRLGSLRVDVAIDASTPFLQIVAVPTLPVQGARLRFDPVTMSVRKTVVDDAGSLLVDITLGLSGAGRVLGPADGPGLAEKPSSVRLVVVLSPRFDRIVSGRLAVSGVQAGPATASARPTTPPSSSSSAVPSPSGSASAASASPPSSDASDVQPASAPSGTSAAVGSGATNDPSTGGPLVPSAG
ncbi:MAG: sigma-70 family RNA polymerase sigma factor [Candidatus Nanopelagicales bacterium]